MGNRKDSTNQIYATRSPGYARGELRLSILIVLVMALAAFVLQFI